MSEECNWTHEWERGTTPYIHNCSQVLSLVVNWIVDNITMISLESMCIKLLLNCWRFRAYFVIGVLKPLGLSIFSVLFTISSHKYPHNNRSNHELWRKDPNNHQLYAINFLDLFDQVNYLHLKKWYSQSKDIFFVFLLLKIDNKFTIPKITIDEIN